MAIDKYIHIVFDDSDPIVEYSTVEHVEVPTENLFNVFLMEDRQTPYGFIGLIAGLETAKFITEKYHGQYGYQCAIVAEGDGKTLYWPEVA